MHTDGNLDADRERRLLDLPGWTWDARTAEWDEAFNRLTEYVKLYGDALVPGSYVDEGYRLGTWVISQRAKHAKGTLDADRERRLLDLPGWTWDPFADQWENGFSRLTKYVELHGDARVPRSCIDDDGYPLGGWVKTQRRWHSAGNLDADRERRLLDLPGWIWDTYVDRWEAGFSRLTEYVELHGDARVPVSYIDDTGYTLGRWVQKQRGRHSAGGLDADRERRLLDLPDWTWDASADRHRRRPRPEGRPVPAAQS